MTLKQLLDHFGDKRTAAFNIGYSEQAVDYWIKEKRIPFKAQRLIQAITNGKLIARREANRGN